MSTEVLETSVLKFFLAVAERKLPFKKSDVLNAIPDLRGIRNFEEIFNAANNHLRRIFGMQIQEIMVKSGKAFIVVPRAITSELVIPRRKRPEKTLLYLVLTYLFMKGEQVAESTLWGFLKSLGIIVGDEHHDYFGNTKKLLTDTFVKQLYILREKVVEEGETEYTFYYSWGVRSTYEVSKKSILTYVAELLKRPAKCFLKQYKEVHDKEIPQPGPSHA